jgi:CheY-like chemotaxis protein
VLEEAVGAATKMLRRVIGEDVRLDLQLCAQPSLIRIDPGQLDQVILNLAVNARDAMPQGGELSIETGVAEFDEAYIDAHWPARVGKFAVLALSDTGMGMTDDVRERIFEPFFTTKGVGKGTGLGLATVYGIVKQSEGFIWVYSEPGKGSTFKIYLPLASGDADAAAGAEHADAAPRGTELVLLAEDSAAVRSTTRRMLERFGYQVLEAPDGPTALAIARGHEHDIGLLLTDVVMPEMSGAELAAAFAELRPGAKVLFMSGYTDDRVVRHGEISAGGHYLQKPFTPTHLARKVRAILDE